MWLFVYWQFWSFIEHRIWREEFRRWGEDCKELFSSVLTPNLGWALEALKIDTLPRRSHLERGAVCVPSARQALPP